MPRGITACPYSGRVYTVLQGQVLIVLYITIPVLLWKQELHYDIILKLSSRSSLISEFRFIFVSIIVFIFIFIFGVCETCVLLWVSSSSSPYSTSFLGPNRLCSLLCRFFVPRLVSVQSSNSKWLFDWILWDLF